MPGVDLTSLLAHFPTVDAISDQVNFTSNLMDEPPPSEAGESCWVPVESFGWGTFGGAKLVYGQWLPVVAPPNRYPLNYSDTGSFIEPLSNLGLPRWQDYFPH